MIRTWVISDPFFYGGVGAVNYEDATVKNGFNFDWIGGETTLRPKPGDVSNGKSWYQHNEPAENGYTNFGSYFVDIDRRVFYAATYIYCPTERPCLILASSDDGIKIWYNHELVHENYANRGINLNDPDKISITLKKGWNSLLVKVLNGENDSGFRIIMAIDENTEYADLEYASYPPVFGPAPEEYTRPVQAVTPSETPLEEVVPEPQVQQAYEQYIVELQTVAPTELPVAYPEFRKYYTEAATPAGGTGDIFQQIGDSVGLSREDAKIACIGVAVVVLVLLVI